VSHALVSHLGARSATGTSATASAPAAPAATGLTLEARLCVAGSHGFDRLGRFDLVGPDLAYRSRLLTSWTILAGAILSRGIVARAILAGTIVSDAILARRPFPAWRARFARTAILSRRACIATPLAPRLTTRSTFCGALASSALFPGAACGTRALFAHTASSAARALFPTSAACAAAFTALFGLAERTPGARRDAHPIGPRAKPEKSVRALVDHRDHRLGA
jgi:hypothetical protein